MDSPSVSAQDLDQDWVWIVRFQAGEESAFTQIFEKYKVRVINLAYRFVRVREAAEDIAQDVFIKIYEKKLKINTKAKFSTWLYRVTVNASVDFLRRKKFSLHSLDEADPRTEEPSRPWVERLPDPSALPPWEDISRKEISAAVQREINRLPEKFRSGILLYQFEEMSYAEIASILGITEKAVERRLYHAKEILRKRLAPYSDAL